MAHKFPSVLVMAAAVREGRLSSVDLVRAAAGGLEDDKRRINSVTRWLDQRALAEAARIDALVAEGKDPGPLAGVPFGVKDLFDVAGLPTTAGAAMRRDADPATVDADAVQRLCAAGAVLVATLNMDEYAYGFVTENAAWGATRNPYDPARLAGGSSGGSAAAVASGMLGFSLGSDTNGSIRIPASLCGVFGLKPTHGALPMEGVYPFVDSFDDIGPFARSARDLAMIAAVLRGEKGWEIGGGATGAAMPRIAMLGGWFASNLSDEMHGALGMLADAWGSAPFVEIAEVERARSAAFLMTAFEGGRRHSRALQDDPMAFDPATRDRFIAGSLLPGDAYDDAQRFRATFREQVLRLFDRHDIVIAPATFGPAPRADNAMVPFAGGLAPARANLGLFTQPISFIGLPVVAAPLRRAPGEMPMGVQLIGPPGSEADLLAFAHAQEAAGLFGWSPPIFTGEQQP